MTIRNLSVFVRSAFVAVLFMAAVSFAQDQNEILTHGLFLKGEPRQVGMTGPVMSKIIRGEAIDARSGEKVLLPDGKAEVWTEEAADSAGWFKGRSVSGSYAYFMVHSASDRVAMLESFGDEMVYVNGVPREGNKYGYKDTYPVWEASFNYSKIPITLKKGRNELLFLCYRGILKVKLQYMKPGVYFNTADVTLPDFLIGQKVDDYAAAVVINATDEPLVGSSIKVSGGDGIKSESGVPLIQPMSVRKVGFRLEGPAPTSEGTDELHLNLSDARGASLAQGNIAINTVSPAATQSVTFISDIDGSVQHYVIVPPRGPDNGKPKALFLSLHGADVITANMAKSYYPKTWGYIVCPTNGRPYGFDWEDWGRMDALQVLNIAKSTLDIDPNRIYLTGHSMGGHGTLINGVTYPDQFAAIGASAGWISWWSYVFHHDTSSTPISEMLRRATMPLNTLKMKENYKQLGVYILQGSKDDNVPITESLDLSDTLSKFDKDFVFHEEMGVGHWWGLGDQAGTDCVDWPPMFDFFARHARPEESRILNIDFTTASPGVSAKDYWLTIYSQIRQFEPSRAIVRFIPSRNRFVGTTDNVKVISFDLSMADKSKPFVVDLDSVSVDSIVVPASSDKIWLEKEKGKWTAVNQPLPGDKGPARYGSFKDAFRHDVIFVYGTHGTKEENRWAFEKARFDAEYFWYQGNGSIDVVSDREFDAKASRDRNVILYGNQKMNSAWSEVVGEGPVTVTEGKIVFGTKVLKGDDYACLMVRPKKGSDSLSVGVVGGTGVEGMRLTGTLQYLAPGFALPDITIIDGKILEKGLEGIKGIGFFGLDWSIQNGDFVWR